MEDITMTSEEYYYSLIGCLWDEEEAQAEVDEMRAAKIGTLKANCWAKVNEDKYIIFLW